MSNQASRRRSPWNGGVRPYHYVPPSPQFLDENLRPAWKAPEENFFRRLGTGALARDLSGVAGGILPFRTPRQMISESIAGVDSTEEFTPEDGFKPDEYLATVTDEATRSILQRAGFDEEYLTVNAVSPAEVDRRIYLAKIQAYNDQANKEYYKNSYVSDYAASTLGFAFDLTADPTVAPSILLTGGLFTGVGRTYAALGAMTEGGLMAGMAAEQQENYAAAITGNESLDLPEFQTGSVALGALMGGTLGLILGGSIGKAGVEGVESAVTRDLLAQLPDDVAPRGDVVSRVVRLDHLADAAIDDKAIQNLQKLAKRNDAVRDNIGELADLSRYSDPEFGPADMYLWIKATDPDADTIGRVLRDFDKARTARDQALVELPSRLKKVVENLQRTVQVYSPVQMRRLASSPAEIDGPAFRLTDTDLEVRAPREVREYSLDDMNRLVDEANPNTSISATQDLLEEMDRRGFARTPDADSLRRVADVLDDAESNVRLLIENTLRKEIREARRAWNDKTDAIKDKLARADELARQGTPDAAKAETRLRLEIEQLDDELSLSPFRDTSPPKSKPIERMRENANENVLSQGARESLFEMLRLDLVGRAGTGGRKFITKQTETVLLQLARMVDTAGTGVVGDFADRTGRGAIFSIRGVRSEANAKIRGFGRAIVKAREKGSVPTKWELNDAIINNRRFGDPARDAVLDEYKKVLDYASELLTRNGKTIQDVYIPGGIQASVVLQNRTFWERELSSAFLRRWESSPDIHFGVAKRARLANDASNDGSLTLSKTKVAQLDDSERAAYMAAMQEEFDEMARTAIERGLGENSLVDLERTGVYTVRRGGSGSPVRTYRQGFDPKILTDPRLREMFDEDASQFVSTYSQNTLARELFDRRIKDIYGEEYDFKALLEEARAVLRETDGNANPGDYLDKILEKYNWAWGAPNPNQLDQDLPKFVVDLGARAARAAYAGAWGVASGLSELPRAILQSAGYSPRLWGETVHDIFRSVASHKYRSDLLRALGQTHGDLSTQFRRSTFDVEIAAGAGVELGLTKKFQAIAKQWMDVWSGRTKNVYKMGYSLGQERALATADAASQLGVMTGGLGYVTEITGTIAAYSMMRNLGRNLPKLRRAAELIKEANTTDVKVFKQLAKQAGMGSEWRMLAAMNRNGMLRSEVIESLSQSISNGMVDINKLQRLSIRGDKAADKALANMVQYMDDRLLEFIPTPTAFTTSTDKSFYANLENMFLSFPRAFYARNGYGSTSSRGQYMVALGVFTMGETLYSAWREFAYRGKDIESLLDEWAENPEEKALDSFARVPLFGPYGSAIVGLGGELLGVGSSSRKSGGSVPTQTIDRFKNEMVDLFRGEGDLKNAAHLAKFTGLGGNAFIWTALSGLDLNPLSEDN